MKSNFHRRVLVALTSLIAFSSYVAHAQISNYVFSQSNGIYQPITGGISLGNASTTNDEYFVDLANLQGGTAVLGNGLPIGFNFNYNGGTYDKFGISTNGWIVLGNGFVNFTGANQTIPFTGTLDNVISGFGRDLQAQTGCSIRFETIGSAPSRILVVQWDRYKRANQVSTDSIGFQIRLNEADNSVNIMYGKTITQSNGNNTEQVGIKGTGALDLAARASTTSWTSTTASTATNASLLFNANIFPPSGLTYTWVIPQPCVAPPNAGTAIVSNTPGCASSKFVSLIGNSTGSGLTYQWISSTDSINWTNLSGATSNSQTITQSVSTYYACIVTCSSVSDTSSVVFVNGISSAVTCYCTTNLHPNANCQSGSINNVIINGTNFSNLNTGCASISGSSYSSYLDTGNLTTTLYAGLTYTFNASSTGNGSISLWIDYNQNGSFDASEWTAVATTGTANNPNTVNVTIPANASLGLTGMRLRYRLTGGQNGAGDACLNFASGETEDYLITIGQLSPCTAPPTAGTASSTASGICASVPFTLQLSGNSLGAGLTFQWEGSSDSLNWTSIVGANNSVYTSTATQTLFYRCVLNCSGSGDTSNVVKVVINPATLCYCTTTLHNNTNCNPAGSINDFSIDGTSLSNFGTGCASISGQSYSSYPASGSTTATLDIGASYNFNVTVLNANNTISLWIDYNQNGVFEATEWTQVSAAAVAGVPSTLAITIPVNAAPGLTGLRIRTRQQGGQNGAGDACTGFASGETEDYLITLVQQQPCVAPPTAGLLAASDSTVCGGVSFTLSLIGASTGSGMGYGWQSSTDGVNWTNISAGAAPFYTLAQSQSTYYRCILNCSGQADTSSAVLVLQNSSTACYCASGATQSTDTDLGNISFGPLNNGVGTPATQNSSANGTYSDFTSLPAQQYTQNNSYPISITQINSANFFAARVVVYIDYNQNGNFNDVGETAFTATTNNAVGGNTVSGSILIPSGAIPGVTRLRAIVSEGNNVPGPCATFQWGETEDYSIEIVQQVPCVAPPVAGNLAAADSSVCAGVNNLLSLVNASSGSGMTYVWESSVDSIAWTVIGGASTNYYVSTQSVATYYRCILTCTGMSDTSSVVYVSQNNLNNCYCTSNATITTDPDIGNVTFGFMNNGTATPVVSNLTAVNTYTDFSGLPVVTYNRNTSYSISVSQITSNANFFAARITAFIDYNQNGSFADNGERVFVGTTSAGAAGNVSTVTGTVIIPATATLGNTKMRVILVQGAGPGLQNPCGTYALGETEDYIINIDQFNGITNEVSAAVNFSVFPNPTSGSANLYYNLDEKSMVQIELYNLLGDRVSTLVSESQSAGNHKLAVDFKQIGLESGLYFAKLRKGNRTETIRFIVQ